MKRIAIGGLIFFVTGLMSLLPLCFHLIPVFIEAPLNDKIRALSGLERFQMAVQSVGWRGLGIGGITTGESLIIDSLYCAYSPLEMLSHPSMDRVAVSGLHLTAHMDDQGIFFHDFPVKPSRSTQPQSSQYEPVQAPPDSVKQFPHFDMEKFLPFLPKEVAVTQAMLTLKRPGEVTSIPFSLSCTVNAHQNDDRRSDVAESEEDRHHLVGRSSTIHSEETKSAEIGKSQKNKIRYEIVLHASLYPFGEAVEIDIVFDTKRGIQSISLRADQMDMSIIDRLVDWVAPDLEIRFKGRSDLHLSPSPFMERGVGGEVGGQVISDRSQKHSVHAAQGENGGPDLSAWRLSLSHLGVLLPSSGKTGKFIKTDIDNVVSHIKVDSPLLDGWLFSGLRSSGDVLDKEGKTSISATGSFWLIPPIVAPLKWNYQFDGDVDRAWQLTMEGTSAVSPMVRLEPPFEWVSVDSPYVKLDIGGKGFKGNGALTAAMQNITVDGDGAMASGVPTPRFFKDGSVTLGRVDCEAAADFDYSDGGKGLSLSFDGRLNQIDAAFHGIRISLPRVKIPGKCVLSRRGEGTLDVKTAFRGGRILADAYALRLNGIDWDVPLHFPFSRAEAGKMAYHPNGAIVAPVGEYQLGKMTYHPSGAIVVREIDFHPSPSFQFFGLSSSHHSVEGGGAALSKNGKDGIFHTPNNEIKDEIDRTVRRRDQKIGHLKFDIEQFSPKGVKLSGAVGIRMEGLLPADTGDQSDQREGGSVQRKGESVDEAILKVNARAEMIPDTGMKLLSDVVLEPIRCTDRIIDSKWLQPYTASILKQLTNGEAGRDLSVVATLSSRGRVAIENGQMDSSLYFDIEDGIVRLPGKEVDIQGIGAAMAFENLPDIRTVPGKEIRIDRVKVDAIDIADVNMRYTLESPTSFLVEKMGFDWCGGRVTTEAMRISTEKSAYHLNLFCDRLGLSAILQQLGSFHAEGEGSLNGRIPISYIDGEISFDDGFLYSTPGKGGVIRITGTDILLAGIPMDSAQFSQVDLAQEALKHYQYEWARLLFDTQGDALVVNMAFDGKPIEVLPFVYKKDVGRFVRVGATNPGSNFQGININVNLKLPFNKVLKFGNRLNSLVQ